MQFCKLPPKTPIKKIVTIKNIDDWKNDSLFIYVDDLDDFYIDYKDVFDCGTYNNLKSGTVDIYGINYYSNTLTSYIIEKILRIKPEDYETLIEWLKKSMDYNGFYILGI